MKSIRTIIADEQVLYTEGLIALMRSQLPELEVVEVLHSGSALKEQCTHHRPDLVLLNIRLPEENGLDLIPQIKQTCTKAKLIILSEYDQTKFIKSAFHNGADGYILKTGTSQDLVACVRDVMTGLTYMGEGVSIGPLHRRPSPEYPYDWSMEDPFMIKSSLTKREIEILQCIKDKKNNKEIAKELFISDQTVGVHRKNIMKKLNVSSTANLIKAAIDNDIIG